MGRQLRDHALDGVDGEMDGERRASRGEGCERFARRHGRSAPRRSRQHQRLRDLRQGQFAAERGGGGGEGRDARRDRIGDAELVEAAQLLAHCAPDRQVAGVQARDVLAGLMRARKFGADLIEVQRRRVDDPRARRAMRQQGLGDQRAGEQADGAARNEIAAAQRDEVRRARTGADEMDRHARASPALAMAQLAPAALMRGATQPRARAGSGKRGGLGDRGQIEQRHDFLRLRRGQRRRRAKGLGIEKDQRHPEFSRRRKEPGFDLLRLMRVERGGRAVAAGILERAPHQRDDGFAWAALAGIRRRSRSSFRHAPLRDRHGRAPAVKAAESIGVRDRRFASARRRAPCNARSAPPRPRASRR